jgi:hypothetical protein
MGAEGEAKSTLKDEGLNSVTVTSLDEAPVPNDQDASELVASTRTTVFSLEIEEVANISID